MRLDVKSGSPPSTIPEPLWRGFRSELNHPLRDLPCQSAPPIAEILMIYFRTPYVVSFRNPIPEKTYAEQVLRELVHAVVGSLLDRARKRQLVAVRISHLEEAFSPGCVSRSFRIEPAFFQMSPERVDIGNVEDQSSPPSLGLALLQVEDRGFCVLDPKGRETRALSTIEKFHAQYITVKPDRLRHVRNPKSDCGNLVNRRRHAEEFTRPSMHQGSANLAANAYGKWSDPLLQMLEVQCDARLRADNPSVMSGSDLESFPRAHGHFSAVGGSNRHVSGEDVSDVSPGPLAHLRPYMDRPSPSSVVIPSPDCHRA